MIKFRKGIGVVLFQKDKNKIKFLILHRKKNWSGWEFIKGGIKDGETPLEALKREIKEETKLKKFKIIGKLDYTSKFKWPKHFIKDHHTFLGAANSYYLVEAFENKIKISKIEHDKYRWVTKAQALKLLTYQDNKTALRKASKNMMIFMKSKKNPWGIQKSQRKYSRQIKNEK